MYKLLLADDEAYVTSVLSRKLADRFQDVLVANDGEEALALARLHRPSLVISDYQMPVMDGFALAVALRDDPCTADVPVMLLTARGHLLSPDELARTNVRSVLAKPFSVKELIAAVDALRGVELSRSVA